MHNGDSVHALVTDTQLILGERKVIDYFQQPLPSPLDDKIAQIIGRFTALTGVQREQFQAALSQQQRSLFGIFGHRRATLSLREESREMLLQGLIGAVIANYKVPPKRRVEIGFAIFHHCALKLSVAPPDIFDEASRYATSALAPTLIQFGQRADITLSKFGWQELKTPDGVKFKFNWR